MDCLPVHSTAESDVADIRAFVTKSQNHSDAVRITYDTRTLNGGFEVDIPSDVELVKQNGFTFDESENRYRYSGGESPFIEYRIGVGDEQYQYASSNNWIFAPTPTHIDVGVNLHPRPGGVIGSEFLYIGNYTRYTTSTDCHEISMIVAADGNLDTPPNDILKALRFTAAEHDVGHRYEVVRIFVTPGNARPGVDGFARENEAWVTKTLSPGSNEIHARVFVHEYIHTRQAFGGNELRSMSWFNEGLADYYSYKMMLELGMIPPEQYNQWLTNGSRMDGALMDPATWESRQVGYAKSGAFFAVLDARIQNSSNASLEDVVRQINGIGGEESDLLVQRFQLLDAVGNVSTNSTAEWVNMTVTTSGSFAIGLATVEPVDENENLWAPVERRVQEKPLVSLVLAFLMGLLLTELVREVSSGNSERE